MKTNLKEISREELTQALKRSLFVVRLAHANGLTEFDKRRGTPSVPITQLKKLLIEAWEKEHQEPFDAAAATATSPDGEPAKVEAKVAEQPQPREETKVEKQPREEAEERQEKAAAPVQKKKVKKTTVKASDVELEVQKLASRLHKFQTSVEERFNKLDEAVSGLADKLAELMDKLDRIDNMVGDIHRFTMFDDEQAEELEDE